jgi:coenzyme PQQ synthesis protein D (PqqD)
MLTLEQQLRPHADVVDTELDAQETVLLHLYSKLYYTLNPTGTLIWQGLKKQLSLGQISRQLQLQFEVEAETADSSVLRLAEELCLQQLVEVVRPA